MAATAGAEEIRLIVRGDDLGMTQGSLLAFERAFSEGVLTSASVIVPAPWFESAAKLGKKNPKWCLGIHLCLVGEWQGYRWRPVLPWDRVASLVDDDGFLYGSPAELWRQKPRLAEIDAELRAQVNLALKKGMRIDYLDTHYVSAAGYPGLAAVIKKIAADYGVPISFYSGERRSPGIYHTPLDRKLQKALTMLSELKPGLWLWVCHPGIDSPEHKALIHTDPRDIFTNGGVAVHRAAELRVLTSPEVRSVITKRRIQLTDYRQIQNTVR